MSDELNDLFAQEMGDVKPLKSEPKIALKQDSRSELAKQALRESAQREFIRDNNHLSSDHVEMLDPYYPLEYKRPGVQHGVFKKLKQGKYAMDARLDLHRMTVDMARKEVFDFIKQSLKYDLRTVMIISGKGSHSRSSGAMLKSYVNKWLPEMDEVQAFCSAQQQHGGVGAVYVLLRKSENKKQQNRDRINKGRVS